MSKSGCGVVLFDLVRNDFMSFSNKNTIFLDIENTAISSSELDVKMITAHKSFYSTKIKRFLDVIFSIFIFIVIFPFFIIVALAILIEDGFPILYRGKRGGYKGKVFRICKFRTMIKNADQVGGGTTALNDSRITKVGKIIRKMKLDEVPNLLNVISGDMSFIGPRPELLQYTERYNGAEKIILEVRPGMTDYSSLEFINLDELVGEKNADEIYEQYILPRKNKLRIKYVATISFFTDAKLFCLTIFKVLKKVCLCIKSKKR